MAGSIDHCLKKDGTYRGVRLLENMGDMAEGVEEMMFVIMVLTEGDPESLAAAKEFYYKCLRGERPWPAWFAEGRIPRRKEP
jgi:hypothetical protein